MEEQISNCKKRILQSKKLMLYLSKLSFFVQSFQRIEKLMEQKFKEMTLIFYLKKEKNKLHKMMIAIK